ncbi:MAG: hypothetical protein V1644_02150 [Candidatus Micrarchaeota archaeon]
MVFLDENAGKVHFALISRGLRCVSSSEIADVCSYFHFSPSNVRATLVRKGALVPLLFKGIFYVRSPEELLLKSLPSDPLLLASLACNKHLGKNWYFGLHTALKFNDLAGVQAPVKSFIITNRQLAPGKRKVGAMEFVFSQIKHRSFDAGLVEKNGFRYSSPVRTSLDFLYFGIKKRDLSYATLVLDAVLDKNRKKFVTLSGKLLGFYPVKKRMRVIIFEHLGGRYVL